MPLKKGNSNRFLSYMDGRFRQQLTIIDVRVDECGTINYQHLL